MNSDCIIMRTLFNKEIDVLRNSGKLFSVKEYERIRDRLTKILEEKEKQNDNTTEQL